MPTALGPSRGHVQPGKVMPVRKCRANVARVCLHHSVDRSVIAPTKPVVLVKEVVLGLDGLDQGVIDFPKHDAYAAHHKNPHLIHEQRNEKADDSNNVDIHHALREDWLQKTDLPEHATQHKRHDKGAADEGANQGSAKAPQTTANGHTGGQHGSIQILFVVLVAFIHWEATVDHARAAQRQRSADRQHILFADLLSLPVAQERSTSPSNRSFPRSFRKQAPERQILLLEHLTLLLPPRLPNQALMALFLDFGSKLSAFTTQPLVLASQL
mmetsp:Transcript_24586/g.57061  ORF Transcript_24586/g.57061 Transcript_24586/m.57061 type:complete len:270 (+) Transcript_24586:169-978(+)